MFRKIPIGLVAASMVLSSAALAQQSAPSTDGVRSERGTGDRGARLSPDDRAAFVDARIAALRAGLRLNADQEKNWPPVESALRDLAKERAQAMEQRRQRRESDERPDPIQRLRNASEAMSNRGAALKRLADASEPLYRSLDDAQKRRLEVLGRQVMRPHGMGRRGRHR
ncbi:Spy/CpxP family protein refolding chaperone [Pseudorhodoplanes sinuspersici]|uniref:Uncharacterized protein n=1 Tax=Pseudorhodoplanes sinuspersici TaxID=1235591 RepID=A0A1W6ZSW8_9HYPH|nr:Spy/CpxP family protein refolding chaperone [Pseudorhodoplanes sinuspersici]ARQ00201.1 hypothetical protein CAK95_14805 [Pseudorhodoplanes sinuspersici]RKE67656.1 LTXXQ motif family protein [Pseudorhodoplanes sinuspersici]